MAFTSAKVFKPTVNNGIAIAAADCALDGGNGNKYIWSQLSMLFIHNTSTTNPLTATISSQSDTMGKSKSISIEIAANSYAVFNLLDSDFPINGEVEVTFSGTTPEGKIIPVELTKP